MTLIKILKEDVYLGDIGSTIQKHVEAEGFSVVQDFCGHGIGRSFHEEPSVLHYGKEGTGEKIKSGFSDRLRAITFHVALNKLKKKKNFFFNL